MGKQSNYWPVVSKNDRFDTDLSDIVDFSLIRASDLLIYLVFFFPGMLHGHDTGTVQSRVVDPRMNLKGKVAMWQQKADQHAEKQKYNFFNEKEGCGVKRVIDKNDPNYGRPEAGSKTDLRGQKAQREVLKEIRELCEIIDEVGYHKKDGTVIITFGQLFDVSSNRTASSQRQTLVQLFRNPMSAVVRNHFPAI
ncbi:actin-binding Rho-activating protein-like [Tropilaelaps mercedesae]|uniref:Actin-binding Rho-activating protein-like n=1 Tax=Tropilaelaps mercedesae TaxID=418985 RepID=A0A1V9WYR3_9ACAR|nr:actin-binding Rho-activating protein-like [Tropilaelaps mercedesae]